jgi:trehalose synthase-fused probable maltokinase
VGWFRSGERVTLLYDAIYEADFRLALLRTALERVRIPGRSMHLHGAPAGELVLPPRDLPSRVLEVEQSNSSLVFADRFFLKLYRRLEEGMNPDAELTRFLSERQHFAHVPAYVGSIECHPTDGPSGILALLVELVPNDGDAWSATLSALRGFYSRVPATTPGADLASVIGPTTIELARRLGQRTGEMHVALAADVTDPAFAPEPFTPQDWRDLHAAMCASARNGLAALREKLAELPADTRAEASELAARGEEILARHARLLDHPIATVKTRIHGDYHLGQVLLTRGDVVILDFEGEPARPLAERRLKASPLRDVAGMLRSFGYAAHTALRAADSAGPAHLAPWTTAWARHMAHTFLDAYRAATVGAPFIPAAAEDFAVPLECFLLDKAIYEVGYELNNRPAWLPIPIAALLAVLRRAP